MKVSQHLICRSDGSGCDGLNRNAEAKAHNRRNGKLHQSSLVTQVIAVKLSKMTKPATLLEETVKSTARAIRGSMMLRVNQRLRMNVGDPNSVEEPP